MLIKKFLIEIKCIPNDKVVQLLHTWKGKKITQTFIKLKIKVIRKLLLSPFSPLVLKMHVFCKDQLYKYLHFLTFTNIWNSFGRQRDI